MDLISEEVNQPVSFPVSCEVSDVIQQPVIVEQKVQFSASNWVVSSSPVRESSAMDSDKNKT